MEEKLKELLGEKLGEMFFKIALQLEKVDNLEKEVEEIKRRMGKIKEWELKR